MPYANYEYKKFYSKAQRKKWKEKNRDKFRAYQKAYRQENFRTFLSYLLSRIRVQKKFECTININFLLNVLELQDACCAISGLPLYHELNDPLSISIDRIDSSKGYVPGNVQLVCQFINLGKNKFSQSDIRDLIFKIRSGVSYVVGLSDGDGI